MAVGDVKSGIATLSAGGVLDIKPPVGEEWIIHNLYYDANGFKMEFIMTNGTIDIPFDNDNSIGARMGMVTHVTNSYYLKVRNSSAGAVMKIAYDGIQTK